MDKQLIKQIVEEFEIRILRQKISEKKLTRDIKILKTQYESNKQYEIAPYLITYIKIKTNELHDAQKAIFDFQQNKHYFINLLNK